MDKSPLSGVSDLYCSDVRLRNCDVETDSKIVIDKTNELNSLIKELVQTKEQEGAAFLLFFASQNDRREYNTLREQKFYKNHYGCSFSLNDFDDDSGHLQGEIYEAIEACKSADKRKINILLSGTGGQIEAMVSFHKYLRDHFSEINVFVYDNVGSALAMFALSSDNLYVRKDKEYVANKSSSISNLDVLVPCWRSWSEDEAKTCLDSRRYPQVSLEKLLVAFDDGDKYRPQAEEVGHGYLYDNPYRKFWKVEYQTLVDENGKDVSGEEAFRTYEKHVLSMYETYKYFGEKIREIRPKVEVDALTAPTSDLLAACRFGKAVYHHGSRMYTYDFDKLGIDDFKLIPKKPKEDGFFSILNKINSKCKELIGLDDIKKVFAFDQSDVFICTEERKSIVSEITGYFVQIHEYYEKKASSAGSGNFYLGFRGQTVDYGALSSSVFRNEKRVNAEGKIYQDSLENCTDIFNSHKTASVPPRHVSHSTPLNICKQQHYGIPTRFLDISFCPLMALYFACSDEKLEFGNGDEPKNGVVYLFSFDENDYDNLYAEQKVLAYSHLVKLTGKEKENLFKTIKDYKRYIELLKRYLDYVYGKACLCEDKNFLHKDFGGIYGHLYDDENGSPYIDSLKILKEKVKANRIDGIDRIIDKLMKEMELFVSLSDVDYAKHRALFLHLTNNFYKDIQVLFFRALLKKHEKILEKILGKSKFSDEARDVCYADFLFSLDEEVLYVPDYSISANARLEKQKGLFLISGLRERIATKLYHKLTIDKFAKEEIFRQLGAPDLPKVTCPRRKSICKVCSCKNGFSFEAVYGDLYGQSKAIESFENAKK